MPSKQTPQELKTIVEKITTETGNSGGKLFREALHCVSKNLTRKEAVSSLHKLLGRAKAKEFVDRLYDATSELRKRKHNQNDSPHEPDSKKPKIENSEIKQKTQNDEKTTQETSGVPNRYITEASEKAKQVTLLHSKIQERLAKHGLIGPVSEHSGTLTDPNAARINVKLNELGQTVDAITGAPITLVHHTPTAKINVRIKRKQLAQVVSSELKRVTPKLAEKTETAMETAHFDPRMRIFSSDRLTRELKFNEPGKFSRMAQTARTKAHLEELQDKIQSIATRTGIADATKLAIVTLRHEAEAAKTPDVEWWDAAILPSRAYAAFDKIKANISLKHLESDLNAKKKFKDFLAGITSLIEHPVPRLPPGEARDSYALPVFLTRAEQAKIRVQRRRIFEKEKQEKIILGLMAPPPPKVKMSNLMRMLGTEAVQDPTKVEAYVKAQIDARKQAHEEANAARKLTPAKKKAKLVKKYKEDTSIAVHVSVYRIWDLSNRSKRFKLDKNAQQNHITGCVLVHQSMNLIVMEGGPKAQKRMKRLLLTRINWSQDVIGSSKTRPTTAVDVDAVYNKCLLVWEGTSGYRIFKNWEFKNVESEAVARDFLKKHNADHYWDLALSFPRESTT